MSNPLKSSAVVLALFLAAASCAAVAETFFAASVRTHANAGANAAAGTLYTIDPVTAAAAVVAPIRLNGVDPIGVTGLAVHPRTGVFYGITGRLSPAAPHALVTIDPETGNATLVGPLGAVGSDIGFSSEGTLYAWLGEINQLATIDLASGRATPIGPSGKAAENNGAFAIAADDTGYVAATGAAGTLDTIDLKSGARKLGPSLAGAPFPDAITNLSFAPSGKLFAVNANSGAPAEAVLVTIDPVSGVVTAIGALPTDIEGLIFAARPSTRSLSRNWGAISSALAAAMLLAIFAAMRLMGRRSKPDDAR
jgi:hypothetical protein